MNWQNEVKTWISKLQKELDGLTAYTSQLISPPSSPKKVPEKLRKVLHVLREGILNLIDKSNSVLKFSSEPSEKLSQLRNEYQKAMQSLQSLYSSFQTKHYNFSTFTSRVRSQSRKEIPSAEKPSKTRSFTPTRGTKEKGLTDIKEKLKALREELSQHEHQKYLSKINKLEKENENIRKMIEEASEDARENLAYLEDIQKRIEKLESKKPQKTQSRYLLKTPSSFD